MTLLEISQQVLEGSDVHTNETNLMALLWNVQSGKYMDVIKGTIKATKANILCPNVLRK